MKAEKTCPSDADKDTELHLDRAGLRRISQRTTGLLLVALLACLGAVLLTGLTATPAHAAAGGLLASEPDGNQQLDEAPGWVTMAFDGKVDKSMAKVIVTDAKGNNVTDGTLIVEDTNVTTQLEDLDKGTYTVHYRVDGKGGEPRGGAFQFSYGQGSFSDQPDKSWSGTAQEPAILRGNEPNGPQESEPPASEQDTPGVQVTATEKAGSSAPTTKAPTTQDPGNTDPDQTDTQEPSDSPTDPSASGTATATQSGPARAFLIGGVVLLLAAGGAGYGLYRTSKRGQHD